MAFTSSSSTNDSHTILVVDDDASVRKLLRHCFENEGYTVFDASTGDEMFRILDTNPVDLVTLDLGLGHEDGIDLARQLRSKSDLSIIMVSARGELIDTVVGLEVGADDYISKPFELREVLARVRSVLRRAGAHSAEPKPADNVCYTFDGWTLNPHKRELTDRNDELVPLTTGEYEMLDVLVSHAQQVLSRDQIMNMMKGRDWHPNDRTIDNHVARLRKKLGAEDGSAPLIKTVRGSGYLFTAQVVKSSG